MDSETMKGGSNQTFATPEKKGLVKDVCDISLHGHCPVE
jgi:hypothetical protein